MNKQSFEDIYNSSIDMIIEKFFSSDDDFFFTEKDIHFQFFHTCLSKNPFEYQNRLLLHSEYPMPFRATTENNNSPIEIVKDEEGQKRRPAIDSVLLNKNFIDWLLNYKPEIDRKKFRTRYTTDDYKNDCIRGLCIYTKSFSDYINDFRGTYKQFNDETGESVLSHSLEFKFFKGGEGVAQPIKDIYYDLTKLSFITEENKEIKKLKFPFSNKCTLLVFVDDRGSRGIIKKIDEKMKEWRKLFHLLDYEKSSSDNGKRHVIHFNFNTKKI